VHSVAKALSLAGADVELSADRATVLGADGLVVPGVGAFDAVMQQLINVRAAELLDKRLTASKPVLGICVGLQVLFEAGVEHGIETAGLGQWPGTVSRMDSPLLPHVGWNTVDAPTGSALFEGIESERFYFVHSYAAREWKLEVSAPFISPNVTWADYGCRFVAAVENGPLSGTQFHPEKSGKAGIRLLTNWLNLL